MGLWLVWGVFWVLEDMEFFMLKFLAIAVVLYILLLALYIAMHAVYFAVKGLHFVISELIRFIKRKKRKWPW